jgi:hypothetical protein
LPSAAPNWTSGKNVSGTGSSIRGKIIMAIGSTSVL